MIEKYVTEDGMATLYCGDCMEVLPTLEAGSVDAVVTDPPYGLKFMGKKWDCDVPSVDVWRECLRVLKPGGHLLCFAGTRTHHRMCSAIEDAGLEIRDMIAWVYGSGFPKSLDVSKAIDKAAGAEREMRVNERWAERYPNGPGGNLSGNGRSEHYGQAKRIIGNPLMTSAPATDAARKWSGWGTALKPALEPITVARKPLIGTVAENVLEYGTGAINVDGCRVWTESTVVQRHGPSADLGYHGNGSMPSRTGSEQGRWPANFIHDGSADVLELFPVTKSGVLSKRYSRKRKGGFAMTSGEWAGDSGSAARFFYCAKASKADRDEGCEGLELRQTIGGGGTNDPNGDDVCGKYGSVKAPSRNHHPTVKPTDLMRYLVRLVTPPGGIVLDPFAGSGSTGKAARLEYSRFVGVELDRHYFEIAKHRIDPACRGLNLHD